MRSIRCVAAAAAAAAVAASSWVVVVNGITPLTLTAERFSAGIVAGRVPRAEGMYGKETLGNGTERPDGKVRFGIGIDTGISTSKHVRTLKWYSTSYCYSTNMPT